MGFLSKDLILSADDLKKEEIDVPEWGGKVCIRTMRGEERDSFEQSIFDGQGTVKDKLDNVRARLLVLVLVDEAGNRLFTDQDIPALGKKSAGVLDRLFEVAKRLNRISRKDVEELAGE